MMKLYYENVLDAAYMAKEFGVEFEGSDDTTLCDTIFGRIICPTAYLVLPESRDIFKPKWRDVVRATCLRDAEIIGWGQKKDFIRVNRESQHCGDNFRWGKYKIIQRDNKAFILPKREKTNDPN